MATRRHLRPRLCLGSGARLVRAPGCVPERQARALADAAACLRSTALAALNGRDVLGSQLGVAWHVVQGAKEDTSQHITVFCGNIGDQIDEYTLFEAFAQYNCSDSRIVRGDDGRCLGYGFVTIRTQVQQCLRSECWPPANGMRCVLFPR